jgi:ATPase subunit of ABC transporter with duplicated ATPase domains
MMLQKPNVLVLDEPTNHLDLESINALNIALQKYDGLLRCSWSHTITICWKKSPRRIWHFELFHSC